jgi:hypothetical protein
MSPNLGAYHLLGMGTIALAAALAGPAAAAVLYKSVSPQGVFEFSDHPPESGQSRLVEQIRMPDTEPGASNSSSIASGPSREEHFREADAAVQRANAQIDLAEHALAEVRRQALADSDPMRLKPTRISRADIERIEYYKKNVRVARQTLLETLQQRRKAGPETYTASNDWVGIK